VYCDTSFLIDLFTALKVPPASFKSLNPFVQARATAAAGFYTWARSQSIELATSLLAIEEGYHTVLFSDLRLQSKKAHHANWKAWRGADPIGFKKAFGVGRGALTDFHSFFESSGIALITFGQGTFARFVPRDPRIVGYARAILLRYEVDTMDAFHYSLMRVTRIETAASSDGDWAVFPYGTVISI
jgi:hypothetical protein